MLAAGRRLLLDGTRGIWALALLSLALLSCAPAFMMRPVVPMLPGQRNEFGFAAGGGVVIDGSAGIVNGKQPGGGAQLWYYHRFKKHFDLGFVGSAGWPVMPNIGAVGLLMRGHGALGDRGQIGVEISGGYIWFELGLPLSLRLADRTWLYTSPGIGVGISGGLGRIPLGMVTSLSKGWSVLFEVDVTPTYWGATTPTVPIYGGLGFSYHWGKPETATDSSTSDSKLTASDRARLARSLPWVPANAERMAAAAPAEPAVTEDYLRQAKQRFEEKHWEEALRLAETPEARAANPVDSTLLAAKAACNLGYRVRVNAALTQLQGEDLKELLLFISLTKSCTEPQP